MSDFDNLGKNSEETQGLVGQRRENSVLFSLDNLMEEDNNSFSSDESESPFGTGDQSGLIDLNTLAKLGAGSGASTTGSVTPMFVNAGAGRSKKGLVIGIVLAVLLLLGVSAVGYYFYQKSEAEKEAQIAAIEAEKARLAKEAEDAKKLAEENEAKLQENKRRQIDKEAELKAALEAEAKEKEAQKQQQEELNKVAQNSGRTNRSGGKVSGSSAPSHNPPKPSSESGAGPDPAAVKSALVSSSTKAQKCAKNGTLTVSFQLQPSGKASRISAVGGSFKGTPTEKCILTVVEKSSFPKFSGKALDVKYTYKL